MGALKVPNYIMHSQAFFIHLIIFESHVHVALIVLEKLKCEFQKKKQQKELGNVPKLVALPK